MHVAASLRGAQRRSDAPHGMMDLASLKLQVMNGVRPQLMMRRQTRALRGHREWPQRASRTQEGLTPPAGGRGRRGIAARGCARRACRRLRPRCRWGGAVRRAVGGLWRGSAASSASIGEFGPSSCIASLATSAAMSLMRSRSSAFSMRSVAQELSACCWIALMSRCSLARSSRATRSCSSTAAFSRLQLVDRRPRAAVGQREFVAQFLDGAFAGVLGLAQLIGFIVALGEQLALGRQAALRDR